MRVHKQTREERRGGGTRMMIGSIARKRWAIERSHEFTKACVYRCSTRGHDIKAWDSAYRIRC